jgi:hypothetical protein
MPTFHVISGSKKSLSAEPYPDVRGITLDGPSAAVVRRAAEILSEHRDLKVQVAGAGGDLDFLADLPPLVDLTVMLSLDLADVRGLAAHADSLRYLHLEKGLPGLDISPVAELTGLEQLYLKGSDRPLRGVERTLAQLSDLRHLTLHSVTLGDPDVLVSLPRLQGMAFKLGGNRDLSVLPSIAHLRSLEIWGTRMLEDLRPVGDCTRLQALHLSELARAAMPDLTGAASLEELHADGMPRLGGLGKIASAPRLRYLSVSNCNLTRDDVEQLKDHPTLRAVSLPLPHQRSRPDDDDPIVGLPPIPQDTLLRKFSAGVMGLPSRDAFQA